MTAEQEIELGAAALSAVDRIIDIVRGARLGHVAPEVATAALRSVEASLAANNAAADAELDKKFPK